jgi:hypothetical protein
VVRSIVSPEATSDFTDLIGPAGVAKNSYTRASAKERVSELSGGFGRCFAVLVKLGVHTARLGSGRRACIERPTAGCKHRRSLRLVMPRQLAGQLAYSEKAHFGHRETSFDKAHVDLRK